MGRPRSPSTSGHDDGRHRADELGLVGPGGKADDLVAMIADALAHAGVAVTDLDRICVTTGPGSFTGVRVGLAAARAFRMAGAGRLTGVSGLAVMARTAARSMRAQGGFARTGDGTVLAVAAEAYRGEIYLGLFDGDGREALADPLALTPADAVGALSAAGASRLVAVGSGAMRLAEAAARAGLDVEPGQASLRPDARNLALFAHELPDAGDESLLPLYLRPPDARPDAGRSLERAGGRRGP
ncbi:MAG: tRNA (adenosine(37)-N6)-threonylcarbamoyltransferase complex dimerization subunit type 1 TsaB [Hyphomicrobiaceae bacterium]